MPTPTKRLKVLLSAYACEPNRGSEPGVGWRWTGGLAELVDLKVLTRESNRSTIETAIQSSPLTSPLRRVQFYYDDLGVHALRLKASGWLPTFVYYVLWQRRVASRFAKLADDMDIVHHLTFCSLLCPGLWRLRHAASVIGPIGAPLVPSEYVSLFGRSAALQIIRGMIMRNFYRMPWLRRVLGQAKAIIPANTDTSNLLTAHGFLVEPVMLDTGAPETIPYKRDHNPETVRFLYAGQLERRKGLELSLRALAKVRSKNWSFTLVGDGPDMSRLVSISRELCLDQQVTFVGRVAHELVNSYMAESDVFLFTSLRDTSGGVNLEAMAAGLPLICLSHQGVHDVTDESCAERIPPGTISETIRLLADAIDRMIANPLQREQMGRCGARRARTNYNWQKKFDAMTNLYAKILESKTTDTKA
jgi:glycosyltransferase involved in cell wall biosynthesis